MDYDASLLGPRHKRNRQLLSPRLRACKEFKRNTSALYDYDILTPLIPAVPLRTIKLVHSTVPRSPGNRFVHTRSFPMYSGSIMIPQHLTTLLALLLSAAPSHSAYNGPCEDIEGVCISTSACAKAGGESLTGYCPYDPTDVKCCVKEPCGGSLSLCTWAD